MLVTCIITLDGFDFENIMHGGKQNVKKDIVSNYVFYNDDNDFVKC